jgi:hypothetical protein
MSKEKAKEYFVKGCNEYLRLFCEKHDFDYEDAKDSWVGGLVGEITMCGDYYVAMSTIIADIEMDAPEAEFYKWYYYNLEVGEYGFVTPNYESWLRGCPRVNNETLEKLRGITKTLEDAIKEENERLC